MYFFAFVIKQGIFISAHINSFHPLYDYLGNLSLLIEHLRSLPIFQCLQQCHIILHIPCVQMWIFLWDRFPIAKSKEMVTFYTEKHHLL